MKVIYCNYRIYDKEAEQMSAGVYIYNEQRRN